MAWWADRGLPQARLQNPKSLYMPSAAYDLAYFLAGVAELDAYLLSKELYWPVGGKVPPGEPPFPRLTLGGLLLARRRLQAWPLSSVQSAQLNAAELRLDAARLRWRVAWENKAAHGFRARLALWRDFLEEYRQAPASHIDRYAYEVRRRVMLALLAKEVRAIPPAEDELLKSLDGLLRSVLLPGEFVWEQPLAAAFPMEVFWYLYGRLKGD
jgi:hypothetical protein